MSALENEELFTWQYNTLVFMHLDYILNPAQGYTIGITAKPEFDCFQIHSFHYTIQVLLIQKPGRGRLFVFPHYNEGTSYAGYISHTTSSLPEMFTQ